jgi:hypothetical protein
VVDSDEEDASTYMNTGSSIGWKHYLQQEDRDISQRKKMRFTPELKGQNLASDVHIRHNPYPVDTEQENTRCFSAWQNGPFALCFPDDQVPETPVAEVTSKDGDGVLRNYAIDADDVAGGGIRLSKSETSTLLFPGQNTKSNSNKTETTETWFQPPWWCQ